MNSKCACCGSEDFNFWGRNTRGCEIYKCTGCGTGYTKVNNAVAADDDLYTTEYYNIIGLTKLLRYLKKSVLFRNRIKNITKLAKSGKVLDFGCGDGSFVTSFDHKDWEIFGTDTSKSARFLAAQKGVSIIEPLNLTEPLYTNFFDAVTCIHVVEHLDDPHVYFEKFNTILKKGGTLLVEVPKFDSLFSKIFKTDWPSNEDMPRHLTHFTKKGLLNLAKSEGFSEVKDTHAFVSGLLYQMFLFNRVVRDKTKSVPLSYFVALCLAPLLALGLLFNNWDSLEILFVKD